MHLSFSDYLIISLYFVFVLGIGFLIKRKVKTSNDFLMSNRSIPLWITSLAFISANLGAQEVIGMAASGAKYGIMTSHFYWLGAIPAMIFLGIFMMPFYYGSRARSVPEYLALRFDDKTRSFNAIAFAFMTIFSSGISLYALALLLKVILGWSFEFSVFMAAGIVLIYTFLGGLTSAVYNEVLQFFLIVLGIAPVVFIGLREAGGWEGISYTLPAAMTHTWTYMGKSNSYKSGKNNDEWHHHFRERGNQRCALCCRHIARYHCPLNDKKIRTPVTKRHHKAQSHHHTPHIYSHRVIICRTHVGPCMRHGCGQGI